MTPVFPFFSPSKINRELPTWLSEASRWAVRYQPAPTFRWQNTSSTCKGSLSHFGSFRCFCFWSPLRKGLNYYIPSLKLRVWTWKWMVGRWFWLLGRPIFRAFASPGWSIALPSISINWNISISKPPSSETTILELWKIEITREKKYPTHVYTEKRD